MNIPTKRFALSTVVTDSDILEYQGQEQLIKEHIEQGLLQKAQTILPQYPGYVITDPFFEVDRDIQHHWTTVTLSFILEKKQND